jgi:hypothetical protein
MADLVFRGASVLVYLFAPLPLALWAARRLRDAHGEAFSEAGSWFAILTVWFCLTEMAGLLIGSLNMLHYSGVMAAEILMALAGMLMLRLDRTHGAGQFPAFSVFRPDRFSAPAAWLAGLGVIVLAWLLLVPSKQYDTLDYHLTVIGTWLHEQHFADQDKSFYIARYPFGWEVCAAMAILAGGSEAFLLICNVAGWAHCALAAYLFSRILGGEQQRAGLAAAFLAVTPIVLWTLHGLNVDVPLAGAFTGCLYAGFAFARRKKLSCLSLFLLNGAILCSVKMSGPVYFLLACAATLAAACFSPAAGRWQREDFRRLLRRSWVLVPALAVFLYAGGYWYFRNLLLWLNPLGFVEIRIGPLKLFSVYGPVEEMARDPGRGTLINLFNWRDEAHRAIFFEQARHYFSLSGLVLLAALPGLLLALLFPGQNTDRRSVFLLAGLLLITAVLYTITPFTGDNSINGWTLTPWMGWSMRYGFPCLAMLAAGAALSRVWLPRWLLHALLAACVLQGAIHLMEYYEALPASGMDFDRTLRAIWAHFSGAAAPHAARVLLFLLGTGGALLLLRIAWSAQGCRRLTRPIALSLCVLIFACLMASAADQYEKAKQERFGPIIAFMRHGIAPEARIAYSWCRWASFYFTPGWRNSITRIPAGSESENIWFEKFMASDADYYACGPWPFEGDERELLWLQSGRLARYFTPVFDGELDVGRVFIFRFERDRFFGTSPGGG